MDKTNIVINGYDTGVELKLSENWPWQINEKNSTDAHLVIWVDGQMVEIYLHLENIYEDRLQLQVSYVTKKVRFGKVCIYNSENEMISDGSFVVARNELRIIRFTRLLAVDVE